MTHTPTPWQAHLNYVLDANDDRIVTCEYRKREDAAFIVRACNAHDELVAERDVARGEVDEYAADAERLIKQRDELVAALQMFDRWPVAHRQDGLRPAFEAARDLLAKLDPPRPYQRTPQQEQELDVMRSRGEL